MARYRACEVCDGSGVVELDDGPRYCSACGGEGDRRVIEDG